MGDLLKFERKERLVVVVINYDNNKSVAIAETYIKSSPAFEITSIFEERGFTCDPFNTYEAIFPNSNIELIRNKEDLLKFCKLEAVDTEALRVHYISTISN